MMMKLYKNFSKIMLFLMFVLNTSIVNVQASTIAAPLTITLDLGEQSGVDPTLQILFLVVLITLLPSMLMILTCFTRIIISLHFLRSALGTQQMPPNQILIGIALFITIFLMGPTFSTINETAIVPYSEGKMTQGEFIETAMEPIREFMISQVAEQDVALFAKLDGDTYLSTEDVPSRVLIPAFMLGELSKGFLIGFIIYIPFLVIDMVVASILMAMGMMMLPPAMISMPFKILFFIMVDGWGLLLEGVIMSFRG